MIQKYKIKISKIDIIHSFFLLLSDKNELYYSNITKGTVDFRLYNDNNIELYLNNINEGDNITIYGVKGNNILINNLPDYNKNTIINIKKIKIKAKYKFIEDSDEEYEETDTII